MNKMWTKGGEEQNLLEKLFREKAVNVTMKPSEVQKSYSTFHGFTAAVFRKHWNETKLMFANIPGVSGICANDGMREVDGVQPSPPKAVKMSFDDGTPSEIATFTQFPIVRTTFTDPDTKQDYCLVVISLLTKVRNVDFDVIAVDDDHILKVTYAWPIDSYDPTTMFTMDRERTTFVNKLHPKFIALEKALENVRDNIEDAPIGTIEIKLPENVLLDPSTWVMYHNRKKDGTLLAFIEIPCARTSYVIKKSEKTLILD